MWISRARGSVSAVLGGGLNVLDRDLREPVRLERAHPLVEAMMAVMPVMVAHFGVAVEHPRLPLHGFDSRRGRGLARIGRKRGRGENGNSEQGCGNYLQHSRLLIQRGSRGCRSDGRFRRSWDDVSCRALNPP